MKNANEVLFERERGSEGAKNETKFMQYSQYLEP